MRVWLDGWEWECCGEPFAVGDVVELGLLSIPSESRSFLAGPLGDHVAAAISHCETHHLDAEDGVHVVLTRGRVASIMAAFWQRAPRAGDDEVMLYPVAGSAVLEERHAVTRSVSAPGDGSLFEGYIVDLIPEIN